MTTRERFLRCMHYQSVDHVPDWEFGYWDEVPGIWKAQGLPASVGSLEVFFGFEWSTGVGTHGGLIPAFQSGVVEETETRRIIRDGAGVLYEEKKEGIKTIPHYLEFPIKNRADWLEYKKRLDPSNPERHPGDEHWAAEKKRLEGATVPVEIGIGSLFGTPRNWMGFEGISMACMDDPWLIHDIVETMCNMTCAIIERPLKEIKIDAGGGWEDIAFNHGCMISPKMFREFLVPRYKRITEICHKYGCNILYVDCDGNIMDVAGLWLESGINCMFPIEVAGGTDPIALRKRFGKDMLLRGGVNKRALISGRAAIDKELARLAPLVEEGGFIPHVDHRCPPDVTYQNYLYYLKRKREMFGIPLPEGCPLPD